MFAPLDKIVSDGNFDADAARYIRTKMAELSASDLGLTKAIAALSAP